MTDAPFCVRIAAVIFMPHKLCKLCPRSCGAPRSDDMGAGFCRSGRLPVLAKAAPHLWEEPCISGDRGSGTVFFSGCSLGCVYCQNRAISRGNIGKAVTPMRLRKIFFELIHQGVHNINLVNPTHFADGILEALEGGLPVPVAYNTGGYDSVQTLRRFQNKVDIYLPDLKYGARGPAAKYSAAPDYPETAKRAILEMFRQTGSYVLGKDGIMKSGVIIRHLILPDNLENTFHVIDWVSETFQPGDVLFSLMSQYTPCAPPDQYPELSRRITADEYKAAADHLESSSISDGYFQELSSSGTDFIPDFDLTGI